LPARRARTRAAELLEQFTLSHAGGRPVKTYSGGMRRRLDLAASLIGDPEILFLDEPTTGLDPTSRLTMWDVIRGLVDGGTTLLLTTQYLEEADQLADRIIVVDGGRVIAEGTSDELKAKVGGELLDVTLDAGASMAEAERILARFAVGPIHVDAEARLLSVPARQDEPGLVTEVVGALAAASIRVDALDVRRPSLDDVFLELTGHAAEPVVVADDEEAA
jgi:ABC-2 type transport system ATP-binding protein